MTKQDFDRHKEQSIKFMKERVIDVDSRDARVWELITDVPKVKTPWQYLWNPNSN
jgi:hypothetical protein